MVEDKKTGANEVKDGVRATTLTPPSPASPRELLEKKAPPARPAFAFTKTPVTTVSAAKESATAIPVSVNASPSLINRDTAAQPHTTHTIEGRVLEGRPISEVEKEVVPVATGASTAGASGKLPTKSTTGS